LTAVRAGERVGAVPASAPDDVVRRLFEARSAGDVRRVMTLLDPAARPYFAPEPAAGLRVELDAHRFEVEDPEHVRVVGRIRVFDGGSLTDSPAAWRFTVRGGRVVRIAPLRRGRRLRPAA
jgi:hypothetical protein